MLKKIIDKTIIALLALALVTGAIGCGQTKGDDKSQTDQTEQTEQTDKTDQTEQTWETPTEGKLMERPMVVNENKRELLNDLNFSKGFNVTLFHANSSNGKIAGTLDYNSLKADGETVWKMAQWGCTKDMVADSAFERNANIIKYADGGKTLQVDVNKQGYITLGINGSVEYTKDKDGNVRERTDASENWPHILIEQSVGKDISPDCKQLYMEISYKVTKCESLVDRTIYPVNEEMNAAQFQWFITLTDTNEQRESYGQAMWFGISMFDTRALGKTPSGMASYDGGKEDSTGLFIYMPSLTQVANTDSCYANVPTAVVGKDVNIKFNVIPFLKQALKIAKQSGALKGATVDHLRIGSTNIGWELPGNYDVEVEIKGFDMYEKF